MDGRKTFALRGEMLCVRCPEMIRAGTPDTVLGAHACKPVVDDHVDHTVLARAESLVRSLMGVAPDDDPLAPPPF